MSRQSKQRKKAVQSKSLKGHNAGNHFAENARPSKVPGDQPKPIWVRPTGAKGWWNNAKPKEAAGSNSKPKWVPKPGQISHF